MKINDIRAMRNRAPFRPFQIHLTNGEVLPVSHPEIMSLPDESVNCSWFGRRNPGIWWMRPKWFA